MPLTIGSIAATAFKGIRSAIADGARDATLTRITQGDYDVTTGDYAEIRTTQTGLAVFQGEAPTPDMFPDYTIGPNDRLLLLQGFTSVKETDLIQIGDKTRIVRAVQDIGGAGSLFSVIVR